MPRQPRLDAPGALHHVMGRGIEKTKILQSDIDKCDFLDRVAKLCHEGYLFGGIPGVAQICLSCFRTYVPFSGPVGSQIMQVWGRRNEGSKS